MKMICCGWKIKENCHVLVNQFHGNCYSQTTSCRKIRSVFRDVKCCFNASWGLKGLKVDQPLTWRDQSITTAIQLVSLADAIRRLQMWIQEIRMWMTTNKLKLRDGKTDFIVIASAYYRQLITSLEIAIKVGNTNIHPTMSVKNLGVTLDTTMTMHPHVNQIVRTVYFHLRSLSRIRRFTNYDTCASVVQLVISRLDYANAVLIGLPENRLRKLQLVQNSVARMITKTRRRDHVTPILKQLHWLPVHLRIVHKVLCLVYKALTFATAPIYIKDMLEL